MRDFSRFWCKNRAKKKLDRVIPASEKSEAQILLFLLPLKKTITKTVHFSRKESPWLRPISSDKLVWLNDVIIDWEVSSSLMNLFNFCNLCQRYTTGMQGNNQVQQNFVQKLFLRQLNLLFPIICDIQKNLIRSTIPPGNERSVQFHQKPLSNQIFHYSSCNTSKRVTSLRGPSLRHWARTTQFLLKKCRSDGVQLETLCPIWSARDLNLPLQRRTRYHSTNRHAIKAFFKRLNQVRLA